MVAGRPPEKATVTYSDPTSEGPTLHGPRPGRLSGLNVFTIPGLVGAFRLYKTPLFPWAVAIVVVNVIAGYWTILGARAIRTNLDSSLGGCAPILGYP